MKFICIHILTITSVLLFMSTFLTPHSNLDNINENDLNIVPNTYDRVIFFIIDSLRYDVMLGNENGELNLPIIDELRTFYGNSTQIAHFLASSPSVTASRIRAFMTGSPSSFSELIMNFTPKVVNSDNLLHQISSKMQKGTFVSGDDTWDLMFSSVINQSFPCNSQKVSDFYEVDDCAIKPFLAAIHNDSANLMMTHLLGMDHVSHIYSAKHELIHAKLNEYDKYLKEIVDTIHSWSDEEQKKTLLIIGGDHGMTDDGNHGGDSWPEINAGIFFYSPKRNYKKQVSHMSQEALVPTIAPLLGVPVPFSNVAEIVPELFPDNYDGEALLKTAKYVEDQVFEYVDEFSKVHVFNNEVVKLISKRTNIPDLNGMSERFIEDSLTRINEKLTRIRILVTKEFSPFNPYVTIVVVAIMVFVMGLFFFDLKLIFIELKRPYVLTFINIIIYFSLAYYSNCFVENTFQVLRSGILFLLFFNFKTIDKVCFMVFLNICLYDNKRVCVFTCSFVLFYFVFTSVKKRKFYKFGKFLLLSIIIAQCRQLFEERLGSSFLNYYSQFTIVLAIAAPFFGNFSDFFVIIVALTNKYYQFSQIMGLMFVFLNLPQYQKKHSFPHIIRVGFFLNGMVTQFVSLKYEIAFFVSDSITIVGVLLTIIHTFSFSFLIGSLDFSIVFNFLQFIELWSGVGVLFLMRNDLLYWKTLVPNACFLIVENLILCLFSLISYLWKKFVFFKKRKLVNKEEADE
eukprot:TRINITY_DN2756_c0_g1_i2.p1 TRINITY_DN2756_c0_g1~~TRINITY_DN2756_c0_g1_i2.p1  ORF type:complete len:747 (+),score=161.52 TRINITY_DN2756_c0_g1_i2:29-2242(+)